MEFSESIDSIHSEEKDDSSIKQERLIHPWDNISPPLDSERISDDKIGNNLDDEDDSPVPEDENKETLMMYSKDELKIRAAIDWISRN